MAKSYQEWEIFINIEAVTQGVWKILQMFGRRPVDTEKHYCRCEN